MDSIVNWIADQIVDLLDAFTVSILDALGCDMTTFVSYFPAADTMYTIFTGIGLGLLLLNLVWQLFKNFFIGMGSEAEDPIKLTMRTIIFVLLVLYAAPIVDIALDIGGTPYRWIVDTQMEPVDFGNFFVVAAAALGPLVSGTAVLITVIVVVVLAWNYIKLLLEAAERYILLGFLVYTAPLPFAMGGAQSTANIFKNWCRMLGGQIVLLMMNAWCLKLFILMVAAALTGGFGDNIFVWLLCAVGFLKVAMKVDSFMSSLGISVGHTGGSMLDDAIVAARGLSGAKKMMMMGGAGKGGSGGSSSGTSSGASASTGFMSGGLVGAVGRKFNESTASNLTAESGSEKGGVFSSIGASMFNNSVGKEGGFASSMIGSVATGSVGRNGMITGSKANDAMSAYMGNSIAGGPGAKSGSSTGTTGGMSDSAGAMKDNGASIPMGADSAAMNVDAAGDGMNFQTDPAAVPTGDQIPASPEDTQALGDNGDSAVDAIHAADAEQLGHQPIPTSMESDTVDDMQGGLVEPIGGGIEMSPDQNGPDAAGSDTSPLIGADKPQIGAAVGASGLEGVSGAGSGAAGVSGNFSGDAKKVSYRDVAMGGGRITGTEVSPKHPNGIEFAMYHKDQYSKPEGKSSVVQSLDGAKWYKQYAQPSVERTPISEEKGKVKYDEKIVQKLPRPPQRLDRM